MPELTPRVVFDCNLFVQGIANRNSPARKALRLFFNGEISLFVSEPIIREVGDVLNRAEIRRQLPGINDRVVNAFLTKLEARAILLANVPEEFHYERDPDDEMYINLAIVADAAYLVSQDNDLLDLMTTSKDIARQFRSRYPFLRIMTAADFVTALESASASR
jgi:putative PIN family toxin of toxin-antitoxin system